VDLTLSLLPEDFSVCHMAPDAEFPKIWQFAGFWSVTRTHDELSLVLPSRYAPADAKVSEGWRALMVQGPLDFSLIGIMAHLSDILAQAGVSIFAISTYDTDYLLVRDADLENAQAALRRNGCTVILPETRK
jgi:uncharacterized protein